jgi:hypothetical protein
MRDIRLRYRIGTSGHRPTVRKIPHSATAARRGGRARTAIPPALGRIYSWRGHLTTQLMSHNGPLLWRQRTVAAQLELRKLLAALAGAATPAAC